MRTDASPQHGWQKGIFIHLKLLGGHLRCPRSQQGGWELGEQHRDHTAAPDVMGGHALAASLLQALEAPAVLQGSGALTPDWAPVVVLSSWCRHSRPPAPRPLAVPAHKQPRRRGDITDHWGGEG